MTERFRRRVIDYLSRNPVTGLLIAKDDQILFEHYQYGRTDRDRLISQSMVKVDHGHAGRYRDLGRRDQIVDDTVETYVPGLKGTEYGATPLRALLHMSSGVEFGEQADEGKGSGRDLDRLWVDMVRGTGFPTKARLPASRNSIGGSRRRARDSTTPASNRMCLVWCCVTPSDKSLSDYLQEKVWEPIGTEADAKWLIDAEGYEVAHSASTPCCATMPGSGACSPMTERGRANRSSRRNGWSRPRQCGRPTPICCRARLRRHSVTAICCGCFPVRGVSSPWSAPSDSASIDPVSKLVMVQTAVETDAEVWRLWSAVVEQFG